MAVVDLDVTQGTLAQMLGASREAVNKHLRALAALMILLYHGLHLIRSRLAFHADFDAKDWIAASNPFVAAIAESHAGRIDPELI